LGGGGPTLVIRRGSDFGNFCFAPNMFRTPPTHETNTISERGGGGEIIVRSLPEMDFLGHGERGKAGGGGGNPPKKRSRWARSSFFKYSETKRGGVLKNIGCHGGEGFFLLARGAKDTIRFTGHPARAENNTGAQFPAAKGVPEGGGTGNGDNWGNFLVGNSLRKVAKGGQRGKPRGGMGGRRLGGAGLVFAWLCWPQFFFLLLCPLLPFPPCWCLVGKGEGGKFRPHKKTNKQKQGDKTQKNSKAGAEKAHAQFPVALLTPFADHGQGQSFPLVLGCWASERGRAVPDSSSKLLASVSLVGNPGKEVVPPQNNRGAGAPRTQTGQTKPKNLP